MNISFLEYQNFYHCQFHHNNGNFLTKIGWWESGEIWSGDTYFYNNYSKGNGAEIPEKYDENLIFRL